MLIPILPLSPPYLLVATVRPEGAVAPPEFGRSDTGLAGTETLHKGKGAKGKTELQTDTSVQRNDKSMDECVIKSMQRTVKGNMYSTTTTANLCIIDCTKLRFDSKSIISHPFSSNGTAFYFQL